MNTEFDMNSMVMFNKSEYEKVDMSHKDIIEKLKNVFFLIFDKKNRCGFILSDMKKKKLELV